VGVGFWVLCREGGLRRHCQNRRHCQRLPGVCLLHPGYFEECPDGAWAGQTSRGSSLAIACSAMKSQPLTMTKYSQHEKCRGIIGLEILAETPCRGIGTTTMLGILRLRALRFRQAEVFRTRCAQDDRRMAFRLPISANRGQKQIPRCARNDKIEPQLSR
jgi:hypothetical protein